MDNFLKSKASTDNFVWKFSFQGFFKKQQREQIQTLEIQNDCKYSKSEALSWGACAQFYQIPPSRRHRFLAIHENIFGGHMTEAGMLLPFSAQRLGMLCTSYNLVESLQQRSTVLKVLTVPKLKDSVVSH